MQLHVEDMTCGGCARSVKAAILSVDPDARVETDPPARSVRVETNASGSAIHKALSEAGFHAEDR